MNLQWATEQAILPDVRMSLRRPSDTPHGVAHATLSPKINALHWGRAARHVQRAEACGNWSSKLGAESKVVGGVVHSLLCMRSTTTANEALERREDAVQPTSARSGQSRVRRA